MREDQLDALRAQYGLTYHVTWAHACEQRLGFRNKRVLEVGGALPPGFVRDILGVAGWTALEAPGFYEALTPEAVAKLDAFRPYNPRSASEVRKPEDLGAYDLLFGVAESLPESLTGVFDLAFSVATFEHLTHIPEVLRQLHRVVRPGGHVFVLTSPIWSSRLGHHLPPMQAADGRRFTFHDCPIPEHGHLLLRPPELYAHLCRHTDAKTADDMVHYVHHSAQINRLFTEDYEAYFNASPFRVVEMVPTGVRRLDNGVQQELQRLHPGYAKFDNAGLMVILERSES